MYLHYFELRILIGNNGKLQVAMKGIVGEVVAILRLYLENGIGWVLFFHHCQGLMHLMKVKMIKIVWYEVDFHYAMKGHFLDQEHRITQNP
jgi:hypothetical protein